MRKFFKKHKATMPKLVSGFTLIEMLITISIILLLSAVVLFDYGSFNSNLALTNLTYDIALTVRQTEYYGIGSKKGTDEFKTGYGVHFDKNVTVYNLFGVSSDSSSYAYKSNFSIAENTLNNGNYISSMYDVSGGACTSLDSADVVYFRPLPKVYFVFNGDDPVGPDHGYGTVSGIVVGIKSPRTGKTMYVKILSSGQIEVSQASGCEPQQKI